MACISTQLHLLNSTTVFPFRPSTLTNSLSSKQRKSWRVSCSSSPLQSRRSISIAALIFFDILSTPKHAIADGVFDKYLKKKKLEPLEVYVPPVILTQSQIKDLGKTLEGDQPQYAAYRSLLRSGPAASLRVNIRAVAQYASENGKGKAATDDVDQCLRALEDLDSLFLRASRNDHQASVDLMKAKIIVALGALDSLLETVPSAVLDKGKAIADAYRVADEEVPEKLDPEMQQLQSLL